MVPRFRLKSSRRSTECRILSAAKQRREAYHQGPHSQPCSFICAWLSCVFLHPLEPLNPTLSMDFICDGAPRFSWQTQRRQALRLSTCFHRFRSTHARVLDFNVDTDAKHQHDWHCADQHHHDSTARMPCTHTSARTNAQWIGASSTS
eukprot:SAG31_NODE_3720_length_3951_cov_2.268172_2_plen_148_part_00